MKTEKGIECRDLENGKNNKRCHIVNSKFLSKAPMIAICFFSLTKALKTWKH